MKVLYFCVQKRRLGTVVPKFPMSSSNIFFSGTRPLLLETPNGYNGRNVEKPGRGFVLFPINVQSTVSLSEGSVRYDTFVV